MKECVTATEINGEKLLRLNSDRRCLSPPLLNIRIPSNGEDSMVKADGEIYKSRYRESQQ